MKWILNGYLHIQRLCIGPIKDTNNIIFNSDICLRYKDCTKPET